MLSHKPSSLPSPLAQIRADVLPFALFCAANTLLNPLNPQYLHILSYVLIWHVNCLLILNVVYFNF